MKSLMFLHCFVQKLSKKIFGGSARPPLVKEGLKFRRHGFLPTSNSRTTLELDLFLSDSDAKSAKQKTMGFLRLLLAVIH